MPLEFAAISIILLLSVIIQIHPSISPFPSVIFWKVWANILFMLINRCWSFDWLGNLKRKGEKKPHWTIHHFYRNIDLKAIKRRDHNRSDIGDSKLTKFSTRLFSKLRERKSYFVYLSLRRSTCLRNSNQVEWFAYKNLTSYRIYKLAGSFKYTTCNHCEWHERLNSKR